MKEYGLLLLLVTCNGTCEAMFSFPTVTFGVKHSSSEPLLGIQREKKYPLKIPLKKELQPLWLEMHIYIIFLFWHINIDKSIRESYILYEKIIPMFIIIIIFIKILHSHKKFKKYNKMCLFLHTG